MVLADQTHLLFFQITTPFIRRDHSYWWFVGQRLSQSTIGCVYITISCEFLFPSLLKSAESCLSCIDLDSNAYSPFEKAERTDPRTVNRFWNGQGTHSSVSGRTCWGNRVEFFNLECITSYWRFLCFCLPKKLIFVIKNVMLPGSVRSPRRMWLSEKVKESP